MKISIFTSMTNPEERGDPWKEALNCYKDIADEVVIVGQDWPQEFKFSYIGEVFQEGFDKSTGDWVIHMDIDNFFHEKDMELLINTLKQNSDLPTITFPKYQIFTPDRFHHKANMCIALNKKLHPNILMNGGGDLCQPTINGELLAPEKYPLFNIPIWNYDSVFKDKEIIKKDRGRFARAWFSEFGEWGDRGGNTDELAYDAWFSMVKKRYAKHINFLTIDQHPKYIQERLFNINPEQFGFNAFGLKDTIKKSKLEYLKRFKNHLIK